MLKRKLKIMAKYKTRKDRRKDRTGAAAFDTSCQCHGGCPWCRDNKIHFDVKWREVADQELKEWHEGFLGELRFKL